MAISTKEKAVLKKVLAGRPLHATRVYPFDWKWTMEQLDGKVGMDWVDASVVAGLVAAGAGTVAPLPRSGRVERQAFTPHATRAATLLAEPKPPTLDPLQLDWTQA